MKSKENAKAVKGMIFAGCSFTWGQGLYYYSNLSTLQEPPPDQYDPVMVRRSHKEFMKSVRYPRIVANHFNTYELVHPQNGGSNEGAVNWWRSCLKNNNNMHLHGLQLQSYSYDEISHVVFQLTQWQRDQFEFTYKQYPYDSSPPQHFRIPFHETWREPYNVLFSKWCGENKIDLNQFMNNRIRTVIDNVKIFLQECENNGIKASLFTWPAEHISYIKEDPWLAKRFITFDYKGATYESIEDLMDPGTMHSKGRNPELTVKWDEDSFAETPKDHHPSLKCHEVMAKNVISFLENVL
jgi:hypothetical protein